MPAPRILVQAGPFDIAAEIALLRECAGNVGAVVTFTGVCRDEDGRLEALELEHYAGMAEAEIGRIAAEAASRWPVDALTVIHRHGVIRPGEDIVLVATAARHREAAFASASFMMDYLKTGAPFWKKEHLAAGGTGAWVEAREEDDAAKARWRPAASSSAQP